MATLARILSELTPKGDREDALRDYVEVEVSFVSPPHRRTPEAPAAQHSGMRCTCTACSARVGGLHQGLVHRRRI